MPQSWFAHFYGVGAAFNLAVLAAMTSMIASATEPPLVLPLLGSLLLQVHLTRRLLESVLVLRYPAGARMHAIAYIFGLRCALLLITLTGCLFEEPLSTLYALCKGAVTT